MNANESTPHTNQFSLLKQRRFAPFFWTQFLGAANDNVFKFAFTVLVTYQLSVSWLPSAMAGMTVSCLTDAKLQNKCTSQMCKPRKK